MARLDPSKMFVIDVSGEMTWPAVTREIAELGWKLRYAPEGLTRENQFVLASIVQAYMQMVHDPAEKRNEVCRQIREAE